MLQCLLWNGRVAFQHHIWWGSGPSSPAFIARQINSPNCKIQKYKCKSRCLIPITENKVSNDVIFIWNIYRRSNKPHTFNHFHAVSRHSKLIPQRPYIMSWSRTWKLYWDEVAVKVAKKMKVVAHRKSVYKQIPHQIRKSPEPQQLYPGLETMQHNLYKEKHRHNSKLL